MSKTVNTWVVAALALLLVACGTQTHAGETPAAGGPGDDEKKVFVCKYVSKPGEDERLQTGDNPISVSVNALVGPGVDVNIGDEFQDAQIRSVVIAFDVGQPEPSPDDCPPPNGGGTTTTTKPTTTSSTTSSTTTTVKPTTTTAYATTTTAAPPPPPPTTTTTIKPTTTSSSTTSTTLSTTTTTQPGVTTTSTTTTTMPPTSTTGPTTTSGPTATSTTSTTAPTTTTTTIPGATTTTTLPPTFQFGGAATICIAEVPTIEIIFQNLFPQLAGVTGTLTMTDVNGNLVSTQPLVYQPGATVHILYPGTSVNPDGTIADVPGWILTNAGLWVRDPTDAFLRDGIQLTYTVNPTATAFITYPPESSACANPENPPGTPTIPTIPGSPTPPGVTPPAAPPGAPPGSPGSPLPPTGNEPWTAAAGALVLAAGCTLLLIGRRKKGGVS